MPKVFFYKLFLILILVSIQVSGFNVLFISIPVPGIIIAAIVSFVVARGFTESLPLWMSLLVGYDLLNAGALTLFVPTGILIAYGASFVSRRYVFEHRGMGLFVLSMVAAGGVCVYLALLSVTQESFVPSTGAALSIILTTVIFYPIFSFTRRFERSMDILSQAEFRGLRH